MKLLIFLTLSMRCLFNFERSLSANGGNVHRHAVGLDEYIHNPFILSCRQSPFPLFFFFFFFIIHCVRLPSLVGVDHKMHKHTNTMCQCGMSFTQQFSIAFWTLLFFRYISTFHAILLPKVMANTQNC